MKKLFTLSFLSVLFLSAISQTTTVSISQVYGGGGGASGTYIYDYVELHNVSSSPQSLAGYSIQYGSATGNFGSGSTLIYAFPGGTTIAAGGYLLIQCGSAGTGGTAFPVAADLITGNLSMAAGGGKVALVTQITGLGCGATATPCTLPGNPVFIDEVAYGTSNNAEGGVSVNNGVALTSTQGCVRKVNGCQDTDNNNNDFVTTTAPVPRNSASGAVNCGAAVATLSAGPSITNLTTNAGVASAPSSYQLSGTNLTGFPDNISVTVSANLEISMSSGSGFGTILTVPYSSATLASTTIYVRIAATAPQGAISGTVTNSGGGAATAATVSVTGGVFQNYYNTKANLGLTNIGTWSTTTDGTGPAPANFTDGYQVFNIINQANANYSGVWNVANAGNTAKIIVGDGVAALTLTVLPGIDSITSASRVDVLNNGTLVLQNNRRPFLNTIATGSTVDFAQSGLTTADTIRVPALTYHHLKLTGGIKYLASGVTTIKGNFTVNGVINFNGAPSPFSTINSFGDIIFMNGSTFEPNPSGDNGRITVEMNGNTGSQSILGNGTDIKIFRLQRDTITSSVDINLGLGTNLFLGNNSGGGLRLNQGAATVTTLVMGSSNLSLIGAGVSTATALGKIDYSGGVLTIAKSALATTAGTLRFVPGASVDQLVLNFDPSQLRDSITFGDDLLVNNNLTLTRGRLVMTSPAVLELGATATITTSADTGFVDGKLKRNTASAAAYLFPVGKGLTYRPVTVSPSSATGSVYTAEYFTGPYSNLTVTAPLTGVSNAEYWDVSRTSGSNATVSLSLNGTAVPGATASDEIAVAHFDAGSWVSVNGTGITPGNATTGTAVSSLLSTFSPFTFGIKPPGGVGTTYTFTGSGNWNNPANWSGGIVPPAILAAPDQIVINPTVAGECVLNVPQQINPGAQIIINPGIKFRIVGNLLIQ